VAAYRIVCAERREAHEHITHVGTGADGDRADQQWAVTEVRRALANGDRFYTISPSTGRTADVRAYDAHVNGRIVQTIRSAPDAVHDNNLDYIRVCRWQRS
jgi:23S rRNA-/tRNA-specific pseudouridylate synthase